MKKKVLTVMLLLIGMFSSHTQAEPYNAGLAVGDKIPDVTLPNAMGQSVNLYDEIAKGPVILSFYRGGWCPYCNEQLYAYQEHLNTIQEMGAQLIAISPETPTQGEFTQVENELTFAVLSDDNNSYARALGIIWEVPADKRQGFAHWLKGATGKTLAEHNGHEGFELPIPATFVINQHGVVTYAFKDDNYKIRAPMDDVIGAVRSVANNFSAR